MAELLAKRRPHGRAGRGGSVRRRGAGRADASWRCAPARSGRLSRCPARQEPAPVRPAAGGRPRPAEGRAEPPCPPAPPGPGSRCPAARSLRRSRLGAAAPAGYVAVAVAAAAAPPPCAQRKWRREPAPPPGPARHLPPGPGQPASPGASRLGRGSTCPGPLSVPRARCRPLPPRGSGRSGARRFAWSLPTSRSRQKSPSLYPHVSKIVSRSFKAVLALAEKRIAALVLHIPHFCHRTFTYSNSSSSFPWPESFTITALLFPNNAALQTLQYFFPFPSGSDSLSVLLAPLSASFFQRVLSSTTRFFIARDVSSFLCLCIEVGPVSLDRTRNLDGKSQHFDLREQPWLGELQTVPVCMKRHLHSFPGAAWCPSDPRVVPKQPTTMMSQT